MRKRGGDIAIPKDQPPSRSWWITDGTRESFNAAMDREAERMRKNAQATRGQMRIVGTDHGRI